ncbi:hypothetical protein [Paraburkholderia fungorum]|uniref:Uncharacterized protein n=1 Tax=Paraburkholderia fungorum TaxID=134537 RepID=A0A3R7EPS6_9BURK|nr:hypothetical protein [Paraburkholderia fungorum]RKF36684.1 hypothetical protein BCY88_35190 [Paraburkholderia fungorum]
MDDRFDRRELLLHLGDVLNALNSLVTVDKPAAPIAHLVQHEASLQRFEFLRTLAPEMTVAEFTSRVASAFFGWPGELLEAELNREGLASTVQRELFAGNPKGWAAYAAQLQKKVTWFGVGLPTVRKGARAGSLHDGKDETAPQASPVTAVPLPDADARIEKKGWPWPEPRS